MNKKYSYLSLLRHKEDTDLYFNNKEKNYNNCGEDSYSNDCYDYDIKNMCSIFNNKKNKKYENIKYSFKNKINDNILTIDNIGKVCIVCVKISQVENILQWIAINSKFNSEYNKYYLKQANDLLKKNKNINIILEKHTNQNKEIYFDFSISDDILTIDNTNIFLYETLKFKNEKLKYFFYIVYNIFIIFFVLSIIYFLFKSSSKDLIDIGIISFFFIAIAASFSS